MTFSRHSISNVKILYSRSELNDFSGPFMPGNDRILQLPGLEIWNGSGEKLYISSTDPDILHSNQDLSALRFRSGQILDGQLLRLSNDGSFHNLAAL
jgi:hypothetical protein